MLTDSRDGNRASGGRREANASKAQTSFYLIDCSGEGGKTITEVDKVITKTCSMYSIKHGVASELWAQVQHRGACQHFGPAVSMISLRRSEKSRWDHLASIPVIPVLRGWYPIATSCRMSGSFVPKELLETALQSLRWSD